MLGVFDLTKAIDENKVELNENIQIGMREIEEKSILWSGQEFYELFNGIGRLEGADGLYEG